LTPASVADGSRLLEEVASEANLAKALLNVVRNKGAPGVDGQTVEAAEAKAPSIIARLRRDLLTERYRPGDVRRVWLPKRGGGQRGLAFRIFWIGRCSGRAQTSRPIPCSVLRRSSLQLPRAVALDPRVTVQRLLSPDQLVSADCKSAYVTLLYLVARRLKATDWRNWRASWKS
jgi:hypothetical protein